MDLPEWDPVVGMVKSQWLSGPIPAQAALHIQCDQAVSYKRLAPSPAARMSVPPPGHGLEIQMALWSATRARGTSPGSYASIPMGARCGPDPTPNPRAPGHAAARSAAGTASRESDEENNLLLCKAYRLDTGLLMGTLQGSLVAQASCLHSRLPIRARCAAKMAALQQDHTGSPRFSALTGLVAPASGLGSGSGSAFGFRLRLRLRRDESPGQERKGINGDGNGDGNGNEA
jgi:hypothetical protein